MHVYFNGKPLETLKKFKNQQRRLFMPTSIRTYQKYLNPSGDAVPLKGKSQENSPHDFDSA
jgi:hypothetical protein